jgi:hypothetical protein
VRHLASLAFAVLPVSGRACILGFGTNIMCYFSTSRFCRAGCNGSSILANTPRSHHFQWKATSRFTTASRTSCRLVNPCRTPPETPVRTPFFTIVVLR